MRNLAAQGHVPEAVIEEIANVADLFKEAFQDLQPRGPR
jgi:hypothetical protein